MDDMTCRIARLAALFTVFMLAVGSVSMATAQVFTGRVDATVEDATGGRLPGVNVELTGPVNQTQVTDAQGQAHFLNLPVGTYAVNATLSGFNTFSNPQVQVATAQATPLTIKLAVAGTAETVNVTAATPILDIRRQTTTTNVTLEELQSIPTARDPWVVMQSVPTIYVDRVNVGGSESGQQSNYMGKGSATTDNTWSIDGVPITDMGAAGSSPTYYDFDMFQEMAVTTGGADAQNASPGVQLNLVLKKGSNTPHGNAKYYFENQDLQSTNIPADLVAALGGTGGKGNRTDHFKDFGFDLGGPLLKDKIWAWGSLAKTDVTNLTLTGTPDQTILKNYAFKADGQLNASIRGNFTYFMGNKVKFGRGASATRPPETTEDQEGPTKYYKGEGNFVVGQNLFAAVRYAHISGGFQLSPQGGLDADYYKDDAGVFHNSYYFFKTTRPQDYVSGDASYFKGKHEVKFGFSWRRTPVDSLSQQPGSKIITIHVGYPDMIAQPQQDFVASTDAKYLNGFVTDTISLNRLTLIAGVRFDRSTSSLSETVAPAVPNFPLLPTTTAAAVKDAYKFTNVTPRVGITYALDDSRKTVARASYAMFASGLGGTAAAFVSPIQPYTYVYYNAVDRNGNKVADPNEIDFAAGVQGSNNVDLAHPGVVSTSNKIGDITAPLTQEAMFGVDREVVANFGVSATFTYRYKNNFLWNPRNGVTQASYRQTGTFTGTFPNVGTVNVPFYGATGAQPGYHAENRPDYHQRYLGFELSATKRMAHRWMARLGFGVTSFNEYFDSPAAILDPTRTSSTSTSTQNLQASGPLVNGGPVMFQTTGSGKSGIYLISPRYQMSANGMYQGPWGFDFGASFNLRQGYTQPFYRSRVNTIDEVVAVKNLLLVNEADQFRLDKVSTFDVRVEKVFKFNRTSLALDLDAFNLFNSSTVLGREYDARLTTYNNVREIMNPRIARLGVRFFF
jgi:hypothetical protein